MLTRRIPISNRFNAKIQKTDGCWIWMGSKATKNGYGRIGLGGWHGKNILAHRLSYELHISQIPSGMKVLHKCDVPACVNPEHLFLGTQKDNCLDMVKKGRCARVRGELCGASKITAKQAIEIRLDSRAMSKIAKAHGISTSQVFNIKHLKHWRHV